MELRKEFGIVSEQVSSNGKAQPSPTPAQMQSQQTRPATEAKAQKKIRQRDREDTGIILKMQKDLFEHARQRARERGALEADSDDLRALENHAQAIAQDAYRALYDPDKHTHDRLLDDEYKKKLKDRTEAEEALKYALATLKEREEEAALAHSGDLLPEEPWPLPVAAVVAIGISAIPTLHDFVFVLPDEFLSWTLSVLSGLFLGLLITLMILSDAASGDRRSAANRLGLAAGILSSLALGAMRIKGASSLGDYVLAAAMTALELSVVLGLERVAMNRCAGREEWFTRKASSDQADAKLKAAKTHAERCQDRLGELNQEIRNHIDYVEDRAIRFLHTGEIESSALTAVDDGYLQGIAENRGRILGLGGNGYERE
jgi:hypothetical protein